VPDARAAARALQGTEGNILLTTGSHTLGIYLEMLPPERLYARVLPDSGVCSACARRCRSRRVT
jgi:precorrin-6x reductase